MITQRFITALFGGTFDPIHKGHLHVATELYQKLPIETIQFIPCHQPAHRPTPIATPQQRLEMLQLAVSEYPYMKLNDVEIRRGGVSYTIDTVKALKTSQPTAKFGLIMGWDAFVTFNHWHQWQAILNYTNLLVVNRPNSAKPLPTALEQLSNVMLVDITPATSAATAIREKIYNKQDVKDELPSSVWHYIQQHSLYLSTG